MLMYLFSTNFSAFLRRRVDLLYLYLFQFLQLTVLFNKLMFFWYFMYLCLFYSRSFLVWSHFSLSSISFYVLFLLYMPPFLSHLFLLAHYVYNSFTAAFLFLSFSCTFREFTFSTTYTSMDSQASHTFAHLRPDLRKGEMAATAAV